MSLVVVNLGLPKTGTTTLSRALKRAGLKVADHRIRPKQTDNTDLHGRFVADLLYEGYFSQGDPAARLGEFSAISEMSSVRAGKSLWPQMDFGLITALRAYHPGLKLVATTRPPEKVSHSMLGWSNLGTERLPKSTVPGLPAGYGGTHQEREIWIAAHYAHLRQLFGDDRRYLELDIEAKEAPDLLAAHLGCEIPWWGTANKSKRAKVDET